jgi:hypothetical protein
MLLLSIIIGVLSAIFLLLRIAQMLGGSVPIAARKKPIEVFSGDRFNIAPLPKRPAKEIAAQISALKTEWVTYNGMTPPLQLLIRGQSYESYRRVVRSEIDVIGQRNFERLSTQQQAEISRLIVARAYVGEWEGAEYTNGNPMPFSSENLSLLIASDPHLEVFIVTEAGRISPPWPTS